MTTTHTQPAGCDLDSLEALDRAATPGPWLWWTSNSFMRLSARGDGDVAHGERLHDGVCTIAIKTADADFIVAARAAMPALIAAARAAQAPQGDTRQGAPEPVAAQFKMPGETWEECSIDEEESMRANGYKFRYLYATPAAHTCTPADERTEQIRLAYADPTGRSKAQMVRDVECLLAHIALLRAPDRAAQGAGTAPVGAAVSYEAALLAVERMRGYAATIIEDHAKDGYPGQLGVRPQDVAKMWALEIHDIDAKDYLNEAVADLATHPAPVSTAAATTASASLDHADLDNTAKEALRDLSHIENHLEQSGAPTTIKNRAVDVRLCIKELRAALKAVAVPSRAADGQQGASRAVLDDAARALEGYADSYDMMTRIGHETVNTRSVAHDIRRNMVNAVRTALARAQLPAQADGQAVDDARDAWQPIETAPADCLLLLAYEFDWPGDWRIKVGGYWNGEWEVFGASWTPTRWSALPPVPNVSDYEARRAAQSRAQSDTTGDHNA